MSEIARGMPPCTTLPTPLTVQLTAVETVALVSHASQLQQWGWRWRMRTEDGARQGNAVLLTHVPCILGSALVAADFKVLAAVLQMAATCMLGSQEHVANLDAAMGTDQLPTAHARLLASKACRTAIMFGTALPRPRCQRLLDELRTTRHCFSCAHGRPTVVPLVRVDMLERATRKRVPDSIAALVQRLRSVLDK